MNYPAIPREFFNGDCFDAYRILGYAQFQLGDKESAKANLQKAIELKDEWAQNVMDTLFK